MSNITVDLVNKALASQLKVLGFKKSALRWNRARGLLTDVVTVQGAKWNSREDIHFAINIGVFVPQFHELVWGHPAKRFIVDADCGNLRKRVDPNAMTDWWNVTPESDINEIIIKLSLRFSEIALPFFDCFASIEDIYRELSNRGNWKRLEWLSRLHLAIASALVGNKQLSCEILDCFRQLPNKGFVEKAERVASSLNKSDWGRKR